MNRAKTTKRRSSNLPIMRAFSVIAVVAVLVGGITYATLQSQQAKLTGNTIQTATADLQISSDGTNYSNTQSGFSFGNLVPGGQAMPLNGYPVYLKNAGGAALTLKLSISSAPNNPQNADLSKVHLILSPNGGGSPQNFTLSALVAAQATGGLTVTTPTQLIPGQAFGYTMQVSMESDAVNGPSATINNVDISFGGSVN